MADYVARASWLHSDVLIPEAVAEELRASRFEYVHDTLDENPWLQVRTPAKAADPALRAAQDAGEAEAIALALEARSPLLIDERRGRRVATAVDGLEVWGTLGMFGSCPQGSARWPLAPLLAQVITSGDHLSQELIRETLRAVGELV